MTFSLQQRVARVGAAARRLRWVYGLARFGAAVLAIVVGLGLIDYLLRLHAPVARWLLSAVGVVLTIIAFLKLAWPAIRLRQSAVSTARRIELRFPDLGERLSSAIAFSAEAVTNPVAGSSALRQAVIAEAEAVSSE